MSTLAPVRVATSTLLTQGQSETAASTVCLSGIVFPPLMPSSVVMTVSADAIQGRREKKKEEVQEIKKE